MEVPLLEDVQGSSPGEGSSPKEDCGHGHMGFHPGPLSMEMQQAHKSHLLKKFRCLMEGFENQGNSTLLRNIYTDLYITEGGWGDVNEEHEVREIERVSWRRPAQERLIKCNDIFENISKKPFGIVLTKGVAGVGKTVSVQKFILDWAEETANQDVDFIFPLPFRELNLMKETTISLVDLIEHFFTDMKKPRVLTNLEHRVMFIFDGLDECRLPLDFHSNPKCHDVTESVPLDVLLTNLIQRNLLPSAVIWITTRPAAVSLIPRRYVNQVTEIKGFNDPQKEEYIRKKLRDESLASRTIAHLKSCRSLYIMCHIPIFCWISATVAENTSDGPGSVEMPMTLTQMYTHFLIIQFRIKNTKYRELGERDEEMIVKLGKLAFQQLEKGNLIFYEEDLRECGIDVTEAVVYTGVCTQIFREEPRLYQGKVFSFVHLSFQEFLAALYTYHCFISRERNMPDQQPPSQLSALFTAATVHDLHNTAVHLALDSRNGHLDLFLRFLLGLSLESNKNLLRRLLPQTRGHPQTSEKTVQLVKQKIRDNSKSERKINLFYCLNELNHHAVVEYINFIGNVVVEMLLPGRWETGQFLFYTSEEYCNGFDLNSYIKTPEMDQTELLSPDDVLQKLIPSDVLTSSTSAELREVVLSEKSCVYLAYALTSKSSHLSDLELTMPSLRPGPYINYEPFLSVSSSAGCHPDCKSMEFWLENWKGICSHLISALTSHTSTLIGNYLCGEEVEHLCSTLSHQDRRLEKLELRNCPLSEKSCSYLASALTSHSSRLTLLTLKGPSSSDSEEDYMKDDRPLLTVSSSAGCHQDCKTWEMRLEGCELTQEISSFVVSAVTSHTSTISGIDLSVEEGERLCSALSHQDCRLEKLDLCSCPLSEQSWSYLASALTSHSSHLTQLLLRYNYLQDSGVELLCSALCHPNCKLITLQLEKAWLLSEKSCTNLASALTSNSSHLTRLSLKRSEDEYYIDTPPTLLTVSSSAGCHPDCKPREFSLEGYNVTEEICSYLVSALTSHTSTLYAENLEEEEVERLCSTLSHPDCRLETLQLDRCALSERSCSSLAWALTLHSSRLTQLMLKVSIQDTSAAEKLSALQNDPHYQVEIIYGQDGPSKWWLHLSCRVLEKSEVAATSAHHPQQSQERNCQTCAGIQEPGHWRVLAPSISFESGECVYTVHSAAGSYECSESGLRWSCAGLVTLQYRISKEELFWAQLQMLGYRPAGPVLEIKLLSGELEEVHLPHSLCLGGSDPAVLGDAVRALHGDDSGVFLETCELSRFHGRLSAQHFSLWQLLVRLGIPVKSHCEVLIYEHCPWPLVLHIYLLPSPSSARQAVESKGGRAIAKPSPKCSLWIDSTVQLHTSPDSLEIIPSELTLNYRNPPTYSEVYLENPLRNFQMEIKTAENHTVWKAVLRQGADYLRKRDSIDTADTQESLTAPADITDQQLMKVAKCMGKEWKQVGISYLGLSMLELDKIQESERDNVTMQRFCMLEQWRRRQHKGKAGVSELYCCLNEDDVSTAVRNCLEGMLKGTSDN